MTLKRALEVDLKLCIFCQKRNKPKDDVRETSSYNRIVVSEATTKRGKYRNVASKEVIDRLEDLRVRNDDTCIVWHGNCYAPYTSEEQSNVCNKRETQVKSFEMQQQFLTVLVKHAVM